MENGNGTPNKPGTPGNEGTPNPGEKNANGEEAAKPTLSPEQQELFNTTLKARLTRQKEQMTQEFTANAESKLNEMLTAKLTELGLNEKGEKIGAAEEKDGNEKTKEQREQHKRLIEEEQRKTLAEKRRAEELKKQNDEIMKQNEHILKMQAIRDALTEARSTHGLEFHSPQEVIKLTEDMIDKNADGKAYIVRQNGVVLENAALEPVGLSEFFVNWAKERPWAVNAETVSGTGSTPGSKGNSGMVTKKSDLKDRKLKADFIDKFGAEAFLALPQ